MKFRRGILRKVPTGRPQNFTPLPGLQGHPEPHRPLESRTWVGGPRRCPAPDTLLNPGKGPFRTGARSHSLLPSDHPKPRPSQALPSVTQETPLLVAAHQRDSDHQAGLSQGL